MWLLTLAVVADPGIKTASASTKVTFRDGVIEATEAKGIGTITVSRPISGWTRLKVRLRRSKSLGLMTAEGLTVEGDNFRGRGRFKKKAVLHWSGDNLDLSSPWFSQNSDRARSGSHFKATRTELGIQLEFSPEFLAGTSTLKVHWVDYYRM